MCQPPSGPTTPPHALALAARLVFATRGKVLLDFAGGAEAAVADNGLDFAPTRVNGDGTPDAGFCSNARWRPIRTSRPPRPCCAAAGAPTARR